MYIGNTRNQGRPSPLQSGTYLPPPQKKKKLVFPISAKNCSVEVGHR